MIRHCVFIRYTSLVSPDDKQSMMADICALQHRLHGILGVHVGANVSPETGMDKGFEDGFMVDFASGEARDAYLCDSHHLAAGARLVAAAEGGAEGIFVYDLELADEYPSPDQAMTSA